MLSMTSSSFLLSQYKKKNPFWLWRHLVVCLTLIRKKTQIAVYRYQNLKGLKLHLNCKYSALVGVSLAVWYISHYEGRLQEICITFWNYYPFGHDCSIFPPCNSAGIYICSYNCQVVLSFVEEIGVFVLFFFKSPRSPFLVPWAEFLHISVYCSHCVWRSACFSEVFP